MAISILLRRKQSIAFAESFTGGMLSDLWHGEVDVAGTLRGAIVIAGGEAAWESIGISEVFLCNFGHCSREVAVAMADGVRKMFSSDFSIAIAAKGCDDRAVYLAVRTPTREIVQRIGLSQSASNRALMREKACYAACKIFLQILFEEPI
jgi:nicotinamide mononucleotide (NMN) deamidase PncC